VTGLVSEPAVGASRKGALIRSFAEFSPCRTWRYALWRVWAEGPALVVLGLNPSTADETSDDPTVRRCIGYARAWGFGGLTMLNIFGFRATDPRVMRAAADPVGPNTDEHIRYWSRKAVEEGGAVLCAWGNHGEFRDRGRRVKAILENAGVPAACLGRTSFGQPKHPLYLPKSALPVSYIGRGGLLWSAEWRALIVGARP